jgi:predicted DNA-binding transcriptional regulator YafY
MGRYSRVEQVGPVDAGGRVHVAMCFEIEEDAIAAILSLGPRVELLEPTMLRDVIRVAAEQIHALYCEG